MCQQLWDHRIIDLVILLSATPSTPLQSFQDISREVPCSLAGKLSDLSATLVLSLVGSHTEEGPMAIRSQHKSGQKELLEVSMSNHLLQVYHCLTVLVSFFLLFSANLKSTVSCLPVMYCHSTEPCSVFWRSSLYLLQICSQVSRQSLLFPKHSKATAVSHWLRSDQGLEALDYSA